MGRVGNNGSFEYKSLADLLGSQPNPATASFLEWSIGNLRMGENAFVANSFRFEERVLVKPRGGKWAWQHGDVRIYRSQPGSGRRSGWNTDFTGNAKLAENRRNAVLGHDRQ